MCTVHRARGASNPLFCRRIARKLIVAYETSRISSSSSLSLDDTVANFVPKNTFLISPVSTKSNPCRGPKLGAKPLFNRNDRF